jgi:hypothetical protein
VSSASAQSLFAPAQDFVVDGYPQALASGDFNRDGVADLAVARTNADVVSILLGTRAGSFALAYTYSTGVQPYDVAVGDLNGDGNLDLAIANSGSSTVSIMLGNGVGGFVGVGSVGAPYTPRGVVLHDMNGDGLLDLVTTDQATKTVSVSLGRGDGTFEPRTDYTVSGSPRAIAVADVNGDSRPDVVVGHANVKSLALLLNQGGGVLGAPAYYTTTSVTLGVALGDVNGDGRVDLIATNLNSATVSVWPGAGDGTFGTRADYVTGSGPAGVALGDVSRDGILDLVIADSRTPAVSVLLGRADGTFQQKTDYSVGGAPFDVVLGPFNSDPLVDIATADPGAGLVSILLGYVPGAHISVTPAWLDFGSGWVGAADSIAVDVGNFGDSVLVVTGMNSSFPEFSVSGATAFALDPGGLREVVIRYSRATAGVHFDTLMISCNDPTSPMMPVALSGSAYYPPRIAVSPASLDFGDGLVNEVDSLALRVSNDGVTTLNVSEVTVSSGEFAVSGATAFSVAPGLYRDVWAKYLRVTEGTASATLTIASNDPASPNTLVSLAGHATAPPAIATAPDSFSFQVAAGDSTSSVLTVSNTGGLPLTYRISRLSRSHLEPGLARVLARVPGDDVPVEKGGRDVVFGAQPLQAGGPDRTGYTYIDSDSPGGPAYNWVDIRSVGTYIGVSGDDRTVGPYPIGFSFPYYGNYFTTFNASTNGFISFTSTSNSYGNVALPSPSAPGNMLAIFWDDLLAYGAYYYNDGSRLIIQYNPLAHYGGSGSYEFEVILYPNGDIIYQYRSMSGLLNSATIGIQDATGSDGLTVAYNANYVHGGLAILYTLAGWLSAAPDTGTVAPQGTQAVVVGASARHLVDGRYEGLLRVTSNDPLRPTLDVPASVQVGVPPPTIVIVAGPAAGQHLNSSTVAFSWTATSSSTPVGQILYRYALDATPSGAWTRDTTVTFTGLAAGAHALGIEARDLLGHVGSLARSFRVDLTPPQTWITSGPADGSWRNSASATFSFTGTDDASATNELRYAWRVDGGAWSALSTQTSAALTGLAEGPHTFEVYVVDKAGNADATPAARSFTVDLTLPTVAYISGPAEGETLSVASATLAWRGADDRAPAGSLQYSRSLDGGGYTTPTPDTTVTLTSLADGTHTLAVRSHDLAGNVSVPVTRTWRVEATPPTIVILSGPAQNAHVNVIDTTFTWTASSSSTPVGQILYRYALDVAPSGAWARDTVATFHGLAAGPHTLNLEAQDHLGHVGTLARSFRVDLTPPQTSIASGPADGGWTNSTSATFGFTGTDDASATNELRYAWRMDGGAWSALSTQTTAVLTGLAEGPHTFEVYAVDKAGNGDPTPAARSFTVDLTLPTVAITQGPAEGETLSVASVTFAWRGADDRTPVGSLKYSRSLDGGAYTSPAADTTVTLTSLADGPHTLAVRSHDLAGNTSTPVTRTWRVEATPPAIVILSGPAQNAHVSVTDTTFSWTATSNNTPVGQILYRYALDAAPSGAWTRDTVATFHGLAAGLHTLNLEAQDRWGHVGVLARSFRVDLTPPQTSITSGPADGGWTNSTSATFGFTGTDDASATNELRYAWRVDGGSWSALSTQTTAALTGLAEGLHTFEVYAVDKAGNVDPTPAARSFTVDLTLPTVAITQGPAEGETLSVATATFAWRGADNLTPAWSLKFSRSLDGGAYTSPAADTTVTLTSLADGSHTLAVRSQDLAGNASTPVTRSWRVEATVPTIVILTGPAQNAHLNVTDTTFSWTATSNNTPVGQILYRYAMDAAPSGAWTRDTVATLHGLAAGVHTLSLEAQDRWGHVGTLARSFRVDLTPPQTSIVSGLADGGWTNSTSATFGFTGTDDASATNELRYAWRVDGGAWSALSTQTSAALTGLAEGPHTFEVYAVDKAGNADASPAARSFTVDLTLPTVVITQGPAEGETLSVATATFTWAGADNLAPVGSLQYSRSLDGGGYTTPTPDTTVTLSSLADGPHTLAVRSHDLAGNVSVPVTRTWRVAATPPTITVLTGPAQNAHVNVTDTTFTWTASSSSTPVGQILYRYALDVAPSGAWARDTVATFHALAAGLHTLNLEAQDHLGHVGTLARSFRVDLTSPQTSIASGPADGGWTNSTSATFGFTGTDDASATNELRYAWRVDGGAWSVLSTQTSAALTGLAEGLHTFEVYAVDKAGNADATPAARSFTVDLTLPTVAYISGPAEGETLSVASATFAWRGADDRAPAGSLKYSRSLDGGAYTTPTADTTVTLTGLAEGPHTLAVRSHDLAGNVSVPVTRTWRVEATAPTILILTGPLQNAHQNATDVTFTWTASSGSTPVGQILYRYALDAAPSGAWTRDTVATLHGLAAGVHTLSLEAQDRWGHVGTLARSFRVDLTPPQTSITSGPADGGWTNSTSATFGFVGADDASAELRFEWRRDGGPWSPLSTQTTAVLTGLAEGPHTFEVRAVDKAGNVDPTPAALSFTVDLTLPTVAIMQGPAEGETLSVASATFAWRGADDRAPAGSLKYSRSLDGGAYTTPTPDTTVTLTGLADGPHTLAVRSQDLAGNVSTPVTRTWRVEATAPAILILTGPAQNAHVNATDTTFSWTASSGSTPVGQILYRYALDAAPSGAWTRDTVATFHGLVAGVHTFNLEAQDRWGHVGSVARSFRVDLTPPQTSIASGPADGGWTNSASTTFGFTGTDDASATNELRYAWRMDGGAWSALSTQTSAALTGLTEGLHTFEVYAVDKAGNADATPAARSFTVDLTLPTVAITQGPAAGETLSVATATFCWVGSDDRTPAGSLQYSRSLDGGAYTSPAAGACATLTSLADGPHTLAVRSHDLAGNVSTPVTRSWRVEATAPAIVILSGPAQNAHVSVADTTFTWTATSGSTPVGEILYRHALDATPSGTWSRDTTASFTGLAATTHTLNLEARDRWGHVGTLARGFRVDLTPPQTSIASGPADGGWTNSTSVTFGFTGTDDASATNELRYAWRADGGAWSALSTQTSAAMTGLVEGLHTFEVYAVDKAGNADPTPAARSFTVDLTPPTVAITQGPAEGETLSVASATFDWRGADDRTPAGSLKFSRSLDGGAYTSPVADTSATLASLADGPHALAVRSHDLAGNASTPVTRTWRVDASAPTIAVLSGPTENAHLNVRDTTFTWTATSYSTPVGAILYRHALDAAPSGTWSRDTTASFTGLAATTHTLNLEARDRWGHVGTLARQFRVDLTPPQTSIASGPADGGWANSASVTFGFTGTDDASATNELRYAWRADGGAWSALSTQTSATAMGLTEGLHTFEVYAVDKAGNADATPAARSFTVDLTLPTAAITQGPAEGDTLPVSSATFAWRGADDRTPAGSLKFSRSLDGGGYTSPAADTSATLTSLADGPHTLAVRSHDLAGNASAPVTRTWQVDASAPTITVLLGPAQNAHVSVTDTTFTWTATSRSTPVGDILYRYALDVAPSGSWTRDTSASFTGLAATTHTLNLEARDRWGHVGTLARSFRVDLTPPQTSIAGGPADGGWANSASATFGFTGTDDASATNELRYAWRADGGSWSALSTQTSATATGLAEGLHTFEVYAVDKAGNADATPAARSFTVDLTPPETQILSGPTAADTLTVASATFGWTGVDDRTAVNQLTYSYRLDGGGWGGYGTATSGTVSGFADGAHSFEVRARDLAGNADPTPAARSFWSDAHGPTITIVSGPAAGTCLNATAVSFAWTGSDVVTPVGAITYRSRLDAGVWTSFGRDTAASFTGLAEGSHTLWLEARDLKGNVGSLTRTFVLDRTNPVADAPTLRVLDGSVVRAQCTAGDNIGISGYHVQIATDTLFASLVLDADFGAAGIASASGSPGHTYWARAYAVDCAGNQSAWSGRSNEGSIDHLPDLTVRSVQAPGTASSGLPIQVSWTVADSGLGGTNVPQWWDDVYLTPTPTPSLSGAIWLGRQGNLTALAAGESYLNSSQVTLPRGAAGTYYLVVVADNTNLVPETNGSNNATVSGPIEVQLSDIADLVVPTATVSPTAYSGDSILVAWVVKNQGQGRTDVGRWWDTVFLSADSLFDYLTPDPQTIKVLDQPLAQRQRIGALEADSSYVATKMVRLPDGIYGKHYVFVAADMNATSPGQYLPLAGEVFENTAELNLSPAGVVEVTLTPPANLAVDSLAVPDSVWSGAGMTVAWRVTNRGYNPTRTANWTDRVYFSADTVLDGLDALMGTFSHSGALGLDEGYLVQGTVTPSLTTSGAYYVFVQTDVNGQVYESDETDNVRRSAQPVVVKLSPWPDLQVSDGTVPETGRSGESVAVSWMVVNAGMGTVAGGSWTDKVYVTRDSNGTGLRELASAANPSGLGPDEMYTKQLSVYLPTDLAGAYYVFVATDVNNSVFEHTDEGNNRLRIGSLTVQWPDLQVSGGTVTATGRSGESVPVSWTVRNAGLGTAVGRSWTDKVYVSRDSTGTGLRELASAANASGLGPGAEYTKQVSVYLPTDLAGTYYVYVTADANNNVYEYTDEGNNRLRIGTITVQWPDLQVSAGSVVAVGQAGEAVPVSWTVTNAGAGTAAGRSWYDKVYVSADPNGANLRELAAASNASGLGPGAAYGKQASVSLPTDLAGSYYVYVVADANNNVYEYSDEGNNGMRIGTLAVTGYPPADVAVTSVSAPDTVASGQSLTVSWSVQNQGTGTTLASSWGENVYLSADSLIDGSDYRLATLTHGGALAPGATFQGQTTKVIPNGMEGTYWVMVREEVSDANAANNVRVSVLPLVIRLTPAPDLVVTALWCDAVGTAGQPLTVRWTATNQGAGVTVPAHWGTAVYLSTDAVLDGSDLLLGSAARSSALAAGASASESLTVSLPGWASGPFYLFAKVDSWNEVYEGSGDGNNTARTQFLVYLPAPADLVVRDVTMPAEAIPGEAVTVGWTLANEGTNAISGQVYNAVYVSSDTSWEVTDPVLAIQAMNVNLPAGQSQRFTQRLSLEQAYRADALGNLTATLPGVPPGSYYGIVRTNVRNTLRELSTANNVGVSADTMRAVVSPLTIGVPATGALMAGQSRYYRVETLAGQDLTVALTSDVVDATNEIYASYGTTPTAGSYDYVGPPEFTSHPSLLISGTEAGAYYVLVTARALPPGVTTESYTLEAHALPFSITAVRPTHGGRAGGVTTTVRGAGLRDTTRLYLMSGSDTVAVARSIEWVSSTELKALWKLAYVSPGTYDLLAMTGDSVATLPASFTVEDATALEVVTTAVKPDVIRRTGTTAFTFRYRNAGNRDVPVLKARLLYPAASTLVNLATDAELQRRSDLYPELFAPVSGDVYEVADTSQSCSYPLEVLDLVAVNVAPEEELSVTLNLRGFERTPFSVRSLTEALETSDYIRSELNGIEQARQAILASPLGWPAAVANLAASPAVFADTAMAHGYVARGLVSAADLADYRTANGGLSGGATNEPAGPPELLAELAAWDSTCAIPEALPECRPNETPLATALPASLSCVRDTVAVPFALPQALTVGLVRASCEGYGRTLVADTRVVLPCDPNVMTGPAGFGADRWVGAGAPLVYRVDFENLSGISEAPAQVVKVQVPIDLGLDPSTFRLGSMGFGGPPEEGGHVITVPPNLTTYTVEPYYADLGLKVRVTAGIDIVQRAGVWTFTSIDPVTNAPPTNPLLGFLPVNDPYGHGQGYVYYTIRPPTGSAHGTRVAAQGAITFDVNTAIATNTAENRVDTGLPASHVLPAVEMLDTTLVRVWWAGADGDSGAGLKSVALYGRAYGTPYQLLASGLTGDSLTLALPWGHQYDFYTIATDQAGNVEGAKTVAEGTVSFGPLAVDTVRQAPLRYALYPSAPNPFHASTVLRFELPVAAEASLEVFDVAGRRVAEPLRPKRLVAGRHSVTFRAEGLRSGMYFCRLKAGRFEQTVKLVLIH